MGVMIRDMAMPCSCWECNFLSMEAGLYIDYVCECVQRSVDNKIVVKGKPDWCPLAEVPTPHGRLIDADTVLPRIEAEINMYKQRLANLPEEPNSVHQNAENTRKRVKGNLLDARASRNELQELIEKSPTIIEAEG